MVLVSKKCGHGTCAFWDGLKESKCSLYEDRRDCIISMQKRKKIAAKSRKRAKPWLYAKRKEKKSFEF